MPVGSARGSTSLGNIRRSAGFAVAVLIGLIAAAPLFHGIPEGADTLLHLYRLVQLDNLIQNGIFYSRWAPDLVFGFGYPLFNYYAPAAYYLGEFLHIMGLGLVGGFLATYILAFIGVAVFTLCGFGTSSTNRPGWSRRQWFPLLPTSY